MVCWLKSGKSMRQGGLECTLGLDLIWVRVIRGSGWESGRICGIIFIQSFLSSNNPPSFPLYMWDWVIGRKGKTHSWRETEESELVEAHAHIFMMYGSHTWIPLHCVPNQSKWDEFRGLGLGLFLLPLLWHGYDLVMVLMMNTHSS